MTHRKQEKMQESVYLRLHPHKSENVPNKCMVPEVCVVLPLRGRGPGEGAGKQLGAGMPTSWCGCWLHKGSPRWPRKRKKNFRPTEIWLQRPVHETMLLSTCVVGTGRPPFTCTRVGKCSNDLSSNHPFGDQNRRTRTKKPLPPNCRIRYFRHDNFQLCLLPIQDSRMTAKLIQSPPTHPVFLSQATVHKKKSLSLQMASAVIYSLYPTLINVRMLPTNHWTVTTCQTLY